MTERVSRFKTQQCQNFQQSFEQNSQKMCKAMDKRRLKNMQNVVCRIKCKIFESVHIRESGRVKLYRMGEHCSLFNSKAEEIQKYNRVPEIRVQMNI